MVTSRKTFLVSKKKKCAEEDSWLVKSVFSEGQVKLLESGFLIFFVFKTKIARLRCVLVSKQKVQFLI